MHTYDQLSHALKLWLELTGVDPQARSFAIKLSGGMDSYTVKTMHDDIQEALELDPTTITGHLLLDALSSYYFAQRAFTVTELMEDPARTSTYIEKAKAFTALTRSPEITALREDFVAQLRTALASYGMLHEGMEALLAERHTLAYLRRDALRSMRDLRVDQFLKGQPETEAVKPVYNGWVHQAWNVNTLVEAVCRMPSGVTLNLVRDPDDLQSYFVFAIRNGGNLWLLSDVPAHAHPLQRYMTRRPERAYASRACRNWYPYDLLDLEFDDASKTYHADAKARTRLIPVQQVLDKRKLLKDLHPNETLWTIMMFDLIVDAFWHKPGPALELSYTGQMLREEATLIQAAEKINLPVTAYPTLALPRLTRQDVRAETVSTEAVGDAGGYPNQWLEDRYANQVDETLLNLLDGTHQRHYLPALTANGNAGQAGSPDAAAGEGGVIRVDPLEDEKRFFSDREGRYDLHAFNATTFGTREEIERDRLYLARHNLAKGIQRLADAEYRARKDEILQWWKGALQQNRQHLLNLVAQNGDELRRVFETRRYPGGKPAAGYWRDEEGIIRYSFLRITPRNDMPLLSLSSQVLAQGLDSRGNRRCYVTGAAVSYYALFQPQTAEDLAELAGCSVSALPDVLQNWCGRRNHEGNHILDRIDPMAWAVHNPWEKFSFVVAIALSKRGLAQLRKKTSAGQVPA